MFTEALFTIAKMWKQSVCQQINRQRKYGIYIHIYTMEYYLTIRKKVILPFVTMQMELEGILLSEISQIEKDKHSMVSLICRFFFLLGQTQKQNTEKLLGSGLMVGGAREKVVNRHKLLAIS